MISAVYLRVNGLSVAVRRTRCMGCRRYVVAGEYRMSVPSVKTVGGPAKFQKGIFRYVCLTCAKSNLTAVIQLARKFRKQVIRKLRVDHAFYATRALGEEFEEKSAAIVKWRVDKIRRSRYNKKVRIKKIHADIDAEYKARAAAVDAAATETELL